MIDRPHVHTTITGIINVEGQRSIFCSGCKAKIDVSNLHTHGDEITCPKCQKKEYRHIRYFCGKDSECKPCVSEGGK